MVYTSESQCINLARENLMQILYSHKEKEIFTAAAPEKSFKTKYSGVGVIVHRGRICLACDQTGFNPSIPYGPKPARSYFRVQSQE